SGHNQPPIFVCRWGVECTGIIRHRIVQHHRYFVPIAPNSGQFPGTNVPIGSGEGMIKAIRQRIRYLNTTDGVKLAWAEAGSGVPLIKASNWLTHLEYDLESPVWRHWLHFLSGNFHFIRFDERGCGMTDWNADDLSVDRWVEDL